MCSRMVSNIAMFDIVVVSKMQRQMILLFVVVRRNAFWVSDDIDCDCGSRNVTAVYF